MTSSEDLHRWSVRLLLGERELSAISPSEHVVAAYDLEFVEGLSLGGMFDDTEPGPWVTVELLAESRDEARVRAQHLVGRAFESAGLRPRELPVLWVASLLGGASTKYLGEARELLEGERYELAVIAAHIAVETQLSSQVRERAAARVEDDLLQVVVRKRQWNLTHSAGQKLLEAILGRRLASFPRWEAFKRHVARRNAVAHGGIEVDAKDARESVEVAGEFWRWLVEAPPAGAVPLPLARVADEGPEPERLFEDEGR